MRYDEIPKFKNFSIDTNLAYGFVGYINFIHDAVQNQGLQMQPWFQRQHVWTEDQQVAYIEFFLKGGYLVEMYFLISICLQVSLFAWMDYKEQLQWNDL